MGQYFQLICIDRQEYHNYGKLTESMYGDAYKLPYMIAKPRREIQPTKLDHESACSLGSLSGLPTDLLFCVFEHMNLVTILSLSVASKRLWGIGWPYIQNVILRSLAPWRGTRLICEGDENDPGDLPPGILSSDELGILQTGLDEDDLEHLKDVFDADDLKEEEYLRRPITLTMLMWARGKKVDVGFEDLSELRYFVYERAPSLSKSTYEEIIEFFHRFRHSKFFSGSQNWTLRNISTKKFVQGRKLNAAFHPNEASTGLNLPHPGFGEAILSQISWSRNEFSSLDLNRGAWAGHRLEIITDEEHLADPDPSWEDESDKVIHTLAQSLELEVHPVKSVNCD